MKPLHEFILVKPTEPEGVSKGGIVIPEVAQGRSQKGTVVAVGPGRVTEHGIKVTPTVHKGDEVIYGKFQGTEVRVEGEPFLLIRETELLAIIDE